ncbi:MAG: type II toxin-antitoxin system VapC family toxin [Candidatus Sulfotelmatobacter sp.]
MTILLDTHILIWSMVEPDRLSLRARLAVENPKNRVLISAAVAWELSSKVKAGKFSPASIIGKLDRLLRQAAFLELPITIEHATRAGSLALHHRDPFDRLLIAQALSLQIPIVSADAIIDKYGVERLW